MQVKLYNTLTGRKDIFTPLDPAHIRVYACGPTVYSYAHIGNARMAVVFDQLVRVLRHKFRGPYQGKARKITYVSNITDVDDKIIQASYQENEPIERITKKYSKIYNADMHALGVKKPTRQPLATEHIPEMISLCKKLIQRKHAYEAEGHVLFSVQSFKLYGSLSGRSRDEQIAGARVDVAPYKKDPADFVLWKPSSAEQPGWDSPWGRGRPGWHIECSAMAEKHLGLPFDIHGGGADLKFPHHENEIAQSCCAHGHENDISAFAKFWVHNGFVTCDGEKMSKSIGNIRLVHNLLKQYPGEVIRYALLSAHYRQPLDFSEGLLRQSKSTLDGLYRRLYNSLDLLQGRRGRIPEIFVEAMYDDLNTPEALAILSQLDGLELRAAGRMLGVLNEDPAVWLGYGGGDADENAAIDALVAERQAAKKDKNFARADEIRATLTAKGIVVEDTPQGPVWRRA